MALALLAAALAVLAVLLPGIVRSEVAERAQRRGFSAAIGSVRLGLGRVWLREVVVTDARLPAARAEIDAVEIAGSPFGGASIRVHGGRVRVAGAREALLERWRALRADGGGTGGSGSGEGARRRIAVEGVDVSFRPDDGDAWILWGVAGRDAADNTADGPSRWTVDLVRGSGSGVEIELRALEVDVTSGAPRRLARAEAVTAALRWHVGDAEVAAPSANPSKPGALAGAASRPKLPSPNPPTAAATAAGPGSAALSPALVALVRETTERLLTPQFRGSVVALNVDVVRAAESLRVGPSRVAAAREGQRLSLEVVPHAATGEAGTPLRLAARVPLSEGPAELELSGGPVSLSALGVREGDFGLVGVREARLDAEAKLRLDPASADVELTTRGRLENARLFRRALSTVELGGIRLGWRLAGSARLDGSRVVLREGELSVGDVRANLDGEIERGVERTRFALRTNVPLASCSELLAALPRGAAPLLEGVVLDGTFSFASRVEYDSVKPDAAAASVNVRNECRVKEVPPAIAPERFRAAWRREVKAADGSFVPIESGPGTPDWTPYEDISPHMETAVIVCEDEGFFVHRGFAYRAIESSIRQNLAAGRFLRGASTVSMQLAKNLYLGKEKTLSRKLQEAVFTLLLEQELSKHELMELYLNVIEYGPGIYGIRQAARYYFNEEPRNLSLGQALYLGSILPSPDSHHFLPDGRVSGAWTRYLQKLMQIAHKIRRISDEELAEGLEEQVAFRKPNLLGAAIAPVDDGAEEEPVVPELDEPRD